MTGSGHVLPWRQWRTAARAHGSDPHARRGICSGKGQKGAAVQFGMVYIWQVRPFAALICTAAWQQPARRHRQEAWQVFIRRPFPPCPAVHTPSSCWQGKRPSPPVGAGSSARQGLAAVRWLFAFRLCCTYTATRLVRHVFVWPAVFAGKGQHVV